MWTSELTYYAENRNKSVDISGCDDQFTLNKE